MLRFLRPCRTPIVSFFSRHSLKDCRCYSAIPSWATVDPNNLTSSKPGIGQNFVNGQWTNTEMTEEIVDPLNGETFLKMPSTSTKEIEPFIQSLRQTPKYGLHNPLNNVERYVLYGDISHKAAAMLRDPQVADFFTRLIQRVSPKSYMQAETEVIVTEKFFENFGGDQVRFLAKSFGAPGNHVGQTSVGYRWPYGPVALITPFNFPFEIPLLQLMGALYMGNKVLIKVDSKVSIVMQEALRMLHACGLPPRDVDLIHSNGQVMNAVLTAAKPRNTLFTGSSAVAEKLALDMVGRIKLEDAGFDWKILGPDVHEQEYVAWTCDQDAYACSGQKCSAQSILFMHQNWVDVGIEEKLGQLAERRKLSNLTIGPVLTVTTERMLGHVETLLKIPGARLSFGGKELGKDHLPGRDFVSLRLCGRKSFDSKSLWCDPTNSGLCSFGGDSKKGELRIGYH
ncbi:hypothetical protein ABG067_006286 [Albugo candida]